MKLLDSTRLDARMAVAVFAAIVAFAATAFAPQVLNDGDTFLHIAAGSRMLADHAVLYADPFSYTFAGAPWDAHEWFAEIVMAAAFKVGSWSGLLLLFAIASAATAGFLAFHLGRWLDWKSQSLVLILALSCMTGSLLARPHLLALPLLEFWVAQLVIARSEKRAPPLAMLPLMTLWANIHASFLLGLGLAAFLALEALMDDTDRMKTLRGWGVFGAGALAAALINPHFVQGVLFPVLLTGTTTSLANIGEWQATDFSQLQPLELVILAAIYFFVTRGVRVPPLRALIVLGLLHMALQHQRHQIVLAVAAPLLLAESLSAALAATVAQVRIQRRAFISGFAMLAVALLGLGALRFALPVVRGDSPVAPIAALAHVSAEMRAQPVLNDYSFGGYLIFAGVRPFIDSRAELYGDAFLQNYAAIIRPDRAALVQTLARHGVRWTILSARSQAVGVMDSLSGWHRAYADAFAVVHIRDSGAR